MQCPSRRNSRPDLGCGGASQFFATPSPIPAVPQGPLKIAQHFSAGSVMGKHQVPIGTAALSCRWLGRPCGTCEVNRRVPSTQVLGYSRSSLRDGKSRAASLQETELRPRAGRSLAKAGSSAFGKAVAAERRSAGWRARSCWQCRASAVSTVPRGRWRVRSLAASEFAFHRKTAVQPRMDTD